MNRQLFQYDPTLGYRFIPGVKARVPHESGGYLVRANQAGFRCERELAAAKPPGTYRVLLFGDSYTAGDGVSNKHRYGDQLEQLLPGVEVYNFGLPGTGTDQQLLCFREVAPALDHDLVVIGVLVENIRRVTARFRPFETADGEPLVLAKPYFELAADGALLLQNVPVPREPVPAAALGDDAQHLDRGGRLEWLRTLVNRAGPQAKALAQKLSRYQPLPDYDRADSPAWLLMRAILSAWFRESKRPVLVVPIPLYQYVEETASPRAMQARFRELAAPPHVTLHDPLPDLLAHPIEQRRAFRFPVDVHPTPAGHRALAESLARAIAPRLAQEAR
jgi:lysophospholipase L1-like esterase